MATKKATGREQRRQTATAKARTPNLSRFYNLRLPAQTPGEFSFKLDLLRPRTPPLALEHMVDSFGWNDQQTVLTGNLTAYRTDPEDASTLPIARGDLIRCRCEWDSHSYELWTMRCDPPQPQIDTGQTSVTLQDDLALLDSTLRDWFFRKTKHQPFGWTADEITVAVARTLGVRIGQLTKTTRRFALVKRNATGLGVIKAAWANEKSASGTGYVLRLRNGRLDVVAIKRNPLLYVLGPQIQTALITQQGSSKVPTTVLEGHAHIGTGKNAKKISYTAFDRKTVQTLGYVHKVKNYGRLSSHAELRTKVKNDYAAGIRVNEFITIDHAGIPFIQRGDGVEVQLPSEGYKGANGFVYATRATHTVTAGIYTTEWDFTLTDPYLDQSGFQTLAVKSRAAKRRTRTRAKVKIG